MVAVLTRETLFKLTGPNGAPVHGGSGGWPLPTAEGPGAWWSVRGALVPCENALHLTTAEHLLSWANEHTSELYVAEYHLPRNTPRPSYHHRREHNKVAVRKARLLYRVEAWDERALRHLAADYAEAVLHHYETAYPGDTRVRDCLAAARRYADGEAGHGELVAAESAAWSAAESAAESAARSAAESAAWSAAESAAWSAARSAAESAAWSAARSAARSAAWSAAESAAWPAAESAAESAAWSAAESAQVNRLLEMLNGGER